MSALQYKHNTNQSTYYEQSCNTDGLPKSVLQEITYISYIVLQSCNTDLPQISLVCVCCHSISATDHASIDGDVQNIDQMNLKDKASLYANYIYYTHKEALLF